MWGYVLLFSVSCHVYSLITSIGSHGQGFGALAEC